MPKKGIEELKEDVNNRPDDAVAHYNLGFAYGELGMYNEAIESYNNALWLDPNFKDAHFNLGVAYLLLNEKELAIEEYKVLENLGSNLAKKLFDMIYK